MDPQDLTCREAARLLFREFDVTLSESDRAALEAHIAECEACVRVGEQARFMRRAMARWRTDRESE
jgi:anti-sigma factor RsiW